MENHKNGFTLIEILMVVGIIALMIIVGIGVYLKQVDKGFDSKRKTDIYKIKVALEEYEKDNDCYPTIEVLECNPGDGLKPYMNKIPCEPNSASGYYYYPEPLVSCPKWYWIFTTLDNTGDEKIVDLGCQYGCGPTQAEARYNYYESSPNADDPYKSDSATATPVGTGLSGRYGCKNYVCTPLLEGDTCDPNYSQADCNGNCVRGNECVGN